MSTCLVRSKKRREIVEYLNESGPETSVYMRGIWNELVEGC